ncbi:MAG: GntR family transcriptional regulator [Betaproteobacteria bacterium]|nr:GntR family transcriptional regulator [Betaproteobacteria bacterium]
MIKSSYVFLHCSTRVVTALRAFAAGGPAAQPLYIEVKNRITRSLIAGEWQPGAAIPSESRLAQQFKVSVGTIRKAIDQLVAEKIVVRQQGRGTFVSIHTEDRQFYYFFHIVSRDGGKEPPTHELLSLQTVKADVQTAAQLGIRQGERLHRVHNVLKLAGNPVIFDELRVAAARFTDLNASSFGARDGTIYGLYQARYGINVVRISERLSAALPSARVARVLGVDRGTPLLVIKRVAYTYHDEPVELRTSWVNTRDHEYLSDLWKSEPR